MNEYEALLEEYLSTINILEERIQHLIYSNEYEKEKRIGALNEQVGVMKEAARMIQKYLR